MRRTTSENAMSESATFFRTLGNTRSDAVFISGRTSANTASAAADSRQGSRKLWPALEGVGTLAGFHFHMLPDHLATLGSGKPGDGLPLGFDPQAALALLPGRYPDVAHYLAHCPLPIQ